MLDILQYDFMRHALIAGLLASIACGLVGTFVVINRLVFLSGSIAHAAYGGIGLSYLLRWDPLVGTVLFTLGSALGMGAIYRYIRARADTLIGVLWAMGMAIGIVCLDLSRGYKADLMGYLFGSILAVPVQDLWWMAILDLLLLVLIALFYKELVAISFDETFATVSNVPVTAIYFLLMGAIALTVVMMMRVVGLILVIALLSIPAAIGERWVKDIRWMMLWAIILGTVFTLVGLLLSYWWNLTSGATIILVAGAAYLLCLVGRSPARS